MSRATDTAMDQLHGMLADTLFTEIEAYKKGERFGVDKEGNKFVLPIPAPLLAQAIKFLKDNGVDAPAREGNRTSRLAGLLREFNEDEAASS